MFALAESPCASTSVCDGLQVLFVSNPVTAKLLHERSLYPYTIDRGVEEQMRHFEAVWSFRRFAVELQALRSSFCSDAQHPCHMLWSL